MQSKFQEKKQNRDNKIAAEFERLLGEGTPKQTAKDFLAEKYDLSATSIYRILK